MSKRIQIDFDEFFTPERAATACQQLAEHYPEFVKLHRIGQTHLGRDLLLLEITNFAVTPSPEERPGYYVDAATHADEVVGISIALYIAWQLATGGAAAEEQIARLLRRFVFYIVPIVNPDGVGVVLNQRMQWVGNGRYLPGEEQPGPGFYYADVNGDGLLAQMRVPDPNGEWKVSALDERILTLRAPDEEDDGPYYRLLPEGLFRDWDGVTMQFDYKPLDGNLNRNYPTNWKPERLQYGAGPYPTSEPEIRAVVDWFLTHPNIGGVMSYHTQGGVILRPFASKPDSEFPPGDLQLHEILGALGTEETGYPVISVYKDFTPAGISVRGGMLMDFTYEELGIPTFTAEIWNLYKEIGIDEVPFYNWVPLPDATMVKVLQWVDQQVPQGFLPWQPFDHPQLGPVEIGGWNRVFVFRNPPKSLLKSIAQQHARFVFRHAATLPRIQIEQLMVEQHHDDIYTVKATIGNAGYLATSLTQQALSTGEATPVLATLKGDGIDILDGSAEREVGHLSGRSERRMEWLPWGDPWGTPRKAVRWVIRGRPGTSITIRAGCPKAGYDTQIFNLE